ncbi:MAG: MCR_0457 family protein [Acinetobacter sp.]
MIKKFALFGTFALSLAALVSPSVMASDLTAEENNTIVKEDIASAQVMAEVCPVVIGKNAKFDSTIQTLIQSYLADYSDKGMSYQKLQADSEYKSLLEEARQSAKQTSSDEQKTVCEEVLDYQG